MDDAVKFGKRVAEMRGKRRMSQQELAERAGLAYQSIWRIERGGQGEPGLFTAVRIARALECSVDYLTGLYETSEDTPAAEELVRA